MSIIEYKDGISKDTNVIGPNVYLGNGQGCGTIWFKTVAQAKAALKKNGIITGRDLADCTKCNFHYSYGTKEYMKYPNYLCGSAKSDYAVKFR